MHGVTSKFLKSATTLLTANGDLSTNSFALSGSFFSRCALILFTEKQLLMVSASKQNQKQTGF